MTLLTDANHPGTQKDMISSQLGRRCGLWCWDCSRPLPSTSSFAHLSLCLQGGRAINPIWLALLWSLLRWVPLFCEHARGHYTALEPSCEEGPLFFFVSLAFPQIGLLCHISPLRLSSGHSNMVLTLRIYHAAHLLWADASVWFTSLLVIVVQHKFCGVFFFFFSFSFSFLVMLFSEFPKLPTDPNCKVSYGVEISPPSWLPPPDRSPSLNTLSFFLSFIFCPASFQKDWVGFLGNLVSSASIQKLFCGSCSTFRWCVRITHIFDVFVGEKVASPSYSSAILELCPLYYSYLENPIDRESWWAIVHGVTTS